jgi:hypothetical protein
MLCCPLFFFSFSHVFSVPSLCAGKVTLLGAHSLGHTHVQHSGYGFVEPSADPVQLNAWDTTPDILDNEYFIKLATIVSDDYPTIRHCPLCLNCCNLCLIFPSFFFVCMYVCMYTILYVFLLQGWATDLRTDQQGSQWRHFPDPLIMVNADMALAFPISTALPPSSGPKQDCAPEGGFGPGAPYGCINPTASTAPSTRELCMTYVGSNAAFLAAFAEAYSKMTSVGYGPPPSAVAPAPAPGPFDGATSSGRLGTLTAIDFNTCY